jgi:hypothetical protein
VQPDPAPRPSHPPSRRPRWLGVAVVGALLLSVLAGAAISVESLGVSPRLLALHLERRASGHNPLIERAAGIAGRWLIRADRGELLPRAAHPAWTGASAVQGTESAPRASGRTVLVTSADEAIAALDKASPGDVITFIPGTYRFSGHALIAARAGRAMSPITVRAERLGLVALEFELLEGFHVAAPYWVFENLEISGVCATHDGCEHAFHVAGAAHHVVIRNNVLRDFNAHVKINGAEGRFPDNGRIVSNTLFNSAPRRTGAPVTPIDLVAASGWSIEGNLIADFVKGGGDQTSYGAFAKGGGAGNRFVGNVVLCEHRLRGAAGRRIGLSFGGGGSNPKACRDRRCIVEHDEGVMADNLIASCSDEGIYLNRAARSRLEHNTVLDTAGVVVRFPESAAHVAGNLIDGPLRSRDDGSLDAVDNATSWLAASFLGWHPVRRLFVGTDELDLRWADAPPRRRDGASRATDLCGGTPVTPPALGAFEDFERCLDRARTVDR